MEKRYQVFVSSTYADLKEERQKVIQTLIEMDCIPSGMELFPAADEEQWEFIKRVIDDCDYYLLIIGGRYGSTTLDGISYTEKEYDYASEKGIKVIAFLHENPDEISFGKSEENPELRDRLNIFREKVTQNRIVKFWNKAEELPGLVSLSLQKTIKVYPAIGWIRADRASSEELLIEVNELRKEYDKLKTQIAQYERSTTVDIPDIASLDDFFRLEGINYTTIPNIDWSIDIQWREIFGLIAPFLLQFPKEYQVKNMLTDSLGQISSPRIERLSLNNQIFQTIKVQLMALKLINVQFDPTTEGSSALIWSLTPNGESLMYQTRTIRTKNAG
jgi:hypothetical protein